MRTDDAKTLYEKYYADKYREFTLSGAIELSLPSIPKISFLASSSKENPDIDVFTKKIVEGANDNKVCLVTKNETPHALLWTTHPGKLKQAVRWGVVKSESITAQTISALGRYRVTAHERVAKGMVSDTQGLKMALLDIYQDRFEALQPLESLVNKSNNLLTYSTAIQEYKTRLMNIREEIKGRFSKLRLTELGYENLADKIVADITDDINRAGDYLIKLTTDAEMLKAANRAKGNDSILEFVKQQMHQGLYEMQGLNQDIVFSLGALTRGELNDCIEDARKLIDDHRPDLRDAVTAKHHGDYSDAEDLDKEVTYDFSLDELSPDEERKALLAISFIEDWDKVDYADELNNNLPTVYNKKGRSSSLKIISATKWNTHQSYWRYIWEYTKNWFKGLIFETHPWDEKGEITLYASKLKQYAYPDKPLWKKGWSFLVSWGLEFKNIFTGVYNFGKKFIIDWPEELVRDWYSSVELPKLEDTLATAMEEVTSIRLKEKSILAELISGQAQTDIDINLMGHKTIFAQPEYHLNYAEDRDILTAATQGLNVFYSHFTHELFSKDPVGGLFFTAAFAVGGACIFFPAFSKTIFLGSYVDGFASFAKLVGSSPLSEAVCGGLMQAQAAHMVWNAGTDGPSCDLVHAAGNILDNPIPVAVGFAAAYGIGYGFANAPIPYVHEFIKDEMGSSDLLNYPVVGIKLGVATAVFFHSGDTKGYHPVEISFHGHELENVKNQNRHQVDEKLKNQYLLVTWLNNNIAMLHKLDLKTRSLLNKHIDDLFEKEAARSLKKLLYVENDRSIAYQFFAIPLGYITAILRLMISMGMSVVAFAVGHPHYFQPVIEAGSALFKKIAKDLTRIEVTASNLLYITVNVVSAPFKALMFTGNMLVSRFAAFAGYHPGHAMYKATAAIHSLYRDIGEFLYPVKVMKSVVYADPAHTVNQVVGTYTRCMESFGIESIGKTFERDNLSKQSSFCLDNKNNSRSKIVLKKDVNNNLGFKGEGKGNHNNFKII